MLLLVTARAEELADAPMLRRTLAELEREPHVSTVALGPLSSATPLPWSRCSRAGIAGTRRWLVSRSGCGAPARGIPSW
jgi:hypothetical protein